MTNRATYDMLPFDVEFEFKTLLCSGLLWMELFPEICPSNVRVIFPHKITSGIACGCQPSSRRARRNSKQLPLLCVSLAFLTHPEISVNL